MRHVHFIVVVWIVSALLEACGGSVTGASDATVDGPVEDSSSDSDAAPAVDASSDAASIGCLLPANCIDGGNVGNAYPPDSGVVCCGTAVTAGTVPECVTTNFSSQCSTPSACQSNIGANSCGTDTLRLCAHASECTEPSSDSCCVADGGVPFCIDPNVAAFLHMQCL